MCNRRRFILVFVSLPFAEIIGLTRILQLSDQSTPALQALFLDLFEDPQGARVVGHRFLTLFQNEAQLGILMAKIFQGGEVPRNKSMLLSYLDTRKRLDFENADVVSVDGWVLSATEARVYAVVALAMKDVL